ncbi:MAG: aspartate carbamoyltransferase [Chloroflexi bacterium]|nr:aspartate carbamoyltransferase [Chloroflexota bacterium]
MKAFLDTYTPPKMNGDFVGKPIVTVEQFTRCDLDQIFATTERIKAGVRRGEQWIHNLCANKIMATLFFEASTRTDLSFQAAMSRLGGRWIGASNGISFSSLYKGESIADTVRAVGCYADAIILRHPAEGASYQAAYYLDMLAEKIGHRAVLVSGGDGIGEHPTQALLDLFTIEDAKGGLDNLQITLVGDLKFGRTVHSLAKLIAIYGGENITLTFVSPESLAMPTKVLTFLDGHGIHYRQTDNLFDVLDKSDIIYWTRVQEERFENPAEYEAIRNNFIMKPSLLEQAKPDMCLLHPLPRKHEMGTEADQDILDRDSRTCYFHQMENGMFVRMALLAKALGVISL